MTEYNELPPWWPQGVRFLTGEEMKSLHGKFLEENPDHPWTIMQNRKKAAREDHEFVISLIQADYEKTCLPATLN